MSHNHERKHMNVRMFALGALLTYVGIRLYRWANNPSGWN